MNLAYDNSVVFLVFWHRKFISLWIADHVLGCKDFITSWTIFLAIRCHPYFLLQARWLIVNVCKFLILPLLYKTLAYKNNNNIYTMFFSFYFTFTNLCCHTYKNSNKIQKTKKTYHMVWVWYMPYNPYTLYAKHHLYWGSRDVYI